MSNNISPWFGKKYRVTPESGKVLRKLVSDADGDYYSPTTEHLTTDMCFMYVYDDGVLMWGDNYYNFSDKQLSDGTKQLEEYMEKMKEQHEWVGCHIGEASKIISMSGQSLRIKFIRNGKEEVMPNSYKDTVFVYLVDFDCYANIPTEKIYQAYKPKIETITVDGVEYDKKKFDAAMKAMKEAEVE